MMYLVKKTFSQRDLDGWILRSLILYWISFNIIYFQNLSGISITLQECEAARKLGGDARKKMIILAGVDKFIKETVTSAFEIWVWELSSKCEGKLNALKLRLIDESPCKKLNYNILDLEGENLEKDIKPLLTEEGTTFKENLHKWLEYFTPMQFQKLDNMWKDYKSR